jgi:hypothetical protein
LAEAYEKVQPLCPDLGVWVFRSGADRVVSWGNGFGGVTYHFHEDTLVGYNSQTDVLRDCPEEKACPNRAECSSTLMLGTVFVGYVETYVCLQPLWQDGPDPSLGGMCGSFEICSPCEERAGGAEEFACTAEQLGIAGD